nr:MAG TPA: hypothetical protein [Bacteriophage sp.]
MKGTMKETRSSVKKKIRISNALRRQLIEEFATTSKTIYQAINYLGSSELLVNIRRSAIEKGAQVVVMAPVDAVLVDMGDKMVRYYRGGAHLDLDKATGDARLYNKDGSLCSTHHSVASTLLPVIEFGKSL